MRFISMTCTLALGCASATDVMISSPGATSSKSEIPRATAATPINPGSNPAAPVTRAGTQTPSGVSAQLPDVEFHMDAQVPAGSEMLRCIYGVMPSDRGVIAVPSAESHYTPGSHHMLAYRSDLTSIPDGQEGVFDCSDGQWQLHERGSYYEAQQPDAERVLPAGIAHEFQPGEIIILQAHYLNTTESDIDAHVAFILHTTDLANVQFEAGSIMFNNGLLDVPPHAKTRASLNCPLPQDIHLALLWSHMHSRGVGFVATTDDQAAAAVLGTLYQEQSWSEPVPRAYPDDPNVVLHAGSSIRFACDYQNDTDQEFVFGNSAETNEMCLLHGMYWPRMPLSAELCFGGTADNTDLSD